METPPIYYLNKADVDNFYTLLSGLVSVEVFTLVSQLVIIGVLLVVIFVNSSKRM